MGIVVICLIIFCTMTYTTYSDFKKQNYDSFAKLDSKTCEAKGGKVVSEPILTIEGGIPQKGPFYNLQKKMD